MDKFTFKSKSYAACMIVEAISEKAAWSYMRSLALEPDNWKLVKVEVNKQ